MLLFTVPLLMAAKLLRNMLIGDVTGRHLNVRNRRRLSPPPPALHGLGRLVGGGGGEDV